MFEINTLQDNLYFTQSYFKDLYRKALAEEKRILKWAMQYPDEFLPLSLLDTSDLETAQRLTLEAQGEPQADRMYDEELSPEQHKAYAWRKIMEKTSAISNLQVCNTIVMSPLSFAPLFHMQ